MERPAFGQNGREFDQCFFTDFVLLIYEGLLVFEILEAVEEQL